MKKCISLILLAWLMIFAANAIQHSDVITMSNNVIGGTDNLTKSVTFSGVKAGTFKVKVEPETKDKDGYGLYYIKINSDEHGYNDLISSTYLKGSYTGQLDGNKVCKVNGYYEFPYTLAADGNVTVELKYKAWVVDFGWTVSFDDGATSENLVIAARNGRTEIYAHGDFACLQVTALPTAVTSVADDGYVWEYSSDNTNWVNGDTNLPNNNDHNNIRPTKAGYYRCKITANGTTYTSNEIQVTTKACPGDYLYANNGATQTNLPIMVIRTGSVALPGWNNGQPGEGVSPDKTKIGADMKIIWNKSGGNNQLNTMDNNNQASTVYCDRKVRINWRGSTSKTMMKRSLAISIGDKSINIGKEYDGFKKAKFDMFGGPEEKDWILYSAYQDKSMMRNKLAMDIWKSMGYWAGTGTFVELYIDGVYQGVYVFMDKYERSGDRVKVTKQGEGTGTDGQTTGYLLKFDKINTSDPGTWVRGNISSIRNLACISVSGNRGGCYGSYSGCGSHGGCGDAADGSTHQGWEVAYPDPDGDLTSAELNYIKDWLTTFETKLYNASTEQQWNEVFSKYVDLQSFVDFMLLEELARNTDGYRASMFFSKDINGKLKCVAPWDFEMGFGNSRTHGGTMTNIWQYLYDGDEADNGSLNNGDSEPYYPIPFWWEKLMTSECFRSAMKTRWAELTAVGGPLNSSTINAQIDAMVAKLNVSNGAFSREMGKWSWTTRNNCGTMYNNCPWIIPNWNDNMSNSDAHCTNCSTNNIHPSPSGYSFTGKTTTVTDEIGLLKAWIVDRVTNLGTLINALDGTVKTKEQIAECSQTKTNYSFTIMNPSSTELCAEEPVVSEIELKLNTDITSTYDATYQWYKDGAAINKATKKSYIAKEAGEYKCVIKVTRIGGIPVWDDNVSNIYTYKDSILITECSSEEPDDSKLIPDNGRTVCVTCKSDKKTFEITPEAGDAIRYVLIEEDGNKKYERNLNTSSKVTAQISTAFTTKVTVTIHTNKYKIVKTFWK